MPDSPFDIVRRHIWVSGRVQGVWFRESMRTEADALGLSGWVRNLPDGRVEAVAEGPAAAVDELLDWCRRGPTTAQVGAIQVTEEQPTLERGTFRVRR